MVYLKCHKMNELSQKNWNLRPFTPNGYLFTRNYPNASCSSSLPYCRYAGKTQEVNCQEVPQHSTLHTSPELALTAGKTIGGFRFKQFHTILCTRKIQPHFIGRPSGVFMVIQYRRPLHIPGYQPAPSSSYIQHTGYPGIYWLVLSPLDHKDVSIST